MSLTLFDLFCIVGFYLVLVCFRFFLVFYVISMTVLHFRCLWQVWQHAYGVSYRERVSHVTYRSDHSLPAPPPPPPPPPHTPPPSGCPFDQVITHQVSLFLKRTRQEQNGDNSLPPLIKGGRGGLTDPLDGDNIWLWHQAGWCGRGKECAL